MKWNKWPKTKPTGNINALVIFNDEECAYTAQYWKNKWWCETYCHEEMAQEEVDKIIYYLDIEDIPLPEDAQNEME